MAKEIHHRASYERSQLNEHSAGQDPIELFHDWLNAAEVGGLPEPHAMVLSTMGADGPSSRIVLLRSFDHEGFVFFTNYNSRKSIDIELEHRVALLFFWQGQERQVRIEGTASRLSDARSDAYFASRPRGSRIGAWASDQSARIHDREALDEKYQRWQERFVEDEIPRPHHWGGFVVYPLRIEFWQGRGDRMHDRLLYTRVNVEAWSRVRLQP